MRFLLFKFFLRITSYFSVDEKWLNKQIHTEKQLKICKERQEEMDACVRPRSIILTILTRIIGKNKV